MSEFGRLEKVDLRLGWTSEAQHFTPWLAKEENLELLSEVLELPLEFEARECSVGPFRADILCKNPQDGSLVLIENQLEQTDHSHLGQLLTYAAGRQAVTMVWIAKRFTEEHRAACDWLNDVTSEDVRIFGIEVELWRIGGSPVAPRFNIVSKPNDWSKIKKGLGGRTLSPVQQAQLEYWSAVEGLIDEKCNSLRAVTPQAQSWLWHALGRTDFGIILSMNTKEKWIRVDISLTGPLAKDHFRQVEAQRDDIAARAAIELIWEESPEKIESRIYCRLDADPLDQRDWPRQHDWLVTQADKLHRIFQPVIKRCS